MDMSLIPCKEINLGPNATLKVSLKDEETRGEEAQSLVERKTTKMEKNIKKSSAEREEFTWVLALEAPRPEQSARPHQPKRTSSVHQSSSHAQGPRKGPRPRQPRKMKSNVNETENEGMHGCALIINHGQDIEERIVTYLQNRINCSENSNGCKRMGLILSATGSVLNTENEGSYAITSLGGRYIISEDGQVQQCGPLTISCVDSSSVVYGGQVLDRLVAAGDVQVVIAVFAYDPSEDEVKN